jgi:urease accessory protein
MNSTSSPSSRALRLASLLLLLPALAQAHPGHGPHDFAAGVGHPLHGVDHLLAMIAVGLWAVQLGGRALWLVPLSFVSVMSLGGALGMSGLHLPMVEQGILASVFVLGLLLVLALRVPLAASMAITALFALFHGYAHGAEMPATASALPYALGFLLSTVLLHACGLAAGLVHRSSAQSAWLRAAGVAVLAGGVFIALS